MAHDVERKSRVIAALKDARIDAVICNSASEVLLLTGYWPVMGASVAVFTAAGEVHVILPEDEVDLAEKTSAAMLATYQPVELAQIQDPAQALAGPLRSLTTQLGLSKATVGVLLHQGMQPATYAVSTVFRSSLTDLLAQLLPGARFVACDKVLETLKARKTDGELSLMGRAVAVAASGFARAAGSIQPGLRETDIAASLQSAFDASLDAVPLQRSYGFFYCMSGPNSARASAAYARTRQRRLEEGDLVMIHANTCADGYWTDITRTYSVGAPSPRHEEMRAAIEAALDAGLRAIHPGVAARDVDKAARSVMEARGMGTAFRHAAGHGVGFAAANANGLPRIHPRSPDVLEAGMTFNLEPAAYFDGYGGMRHCDVVAVAPSGASVLTQF